MPNPPTRSRVDVASIGETMVAFTGRDGSRDYVAVVAGAESNVAVGIAALGHSSRWVSRLGDDQLGRLVADEVAARGVDVEVDWDPIHPTGVMTKHVGDGATERRYYRSQSAARLLGPGDADRIGPAGWVHITGITPAISESAARLVRAVLARRDRHGARVSFDVNLRPQLWSDLGEAAAVTADIARAADLVLVGDDEARDLFGTDDIDRLTESLTGRPGQELVVKRGAAPASAVVDREVVTVSTLGAPVLDPTGAGDAFAAGYLAGCVRGWSPRSRLQLGHVLAARVIGVVGDTVPAPDPHELVALTPTGLDRLWSDRGLA